MRVFILFYALFLSLFLSTIVVAGEGFVAGTLVRIPTGYTCIQDLCATDEVLVYTFDDGVTSEAITTITSHEVDTIVRLEVEGDTFELAHDQLLFAPLQRKWLPASKIQEGMYLLGSPLRAVQVQSVRKIDQCTQVYALTLNEHHNYLVGKHGIVVHNFGPMVFGAVGAAEGLTFLNVFLAANPLVAPVTIAVGGTGLIGGLIWHAISDIKESRKAKRDKGKSRGSNGSGGNEDKDPKSVGAAAVALLKAIDESKEKAVEVFNKTCEYLASEAGISRVLHAFRANCRHNFGPLLARMGVDINNTLPEGEQRVIQAGTKIMADITKKLIDMGSKLMVDREGVFQNVVVEYERELITVRGCIHDGIFKIGTMFIQSQHVRKLV